MAMKKIALEEHFLGPGFEEFSNTFLDKIPPETRKTLKRRLEDIVNGQVRSFAYPFGARGDYSSTTIKLVRSAGYECACISSFGRSKLLNLMLVKCSCDMISQRNEFK